MRRHGFHKFHRMCGERAPFHYLDCTRVQFVSRKSADERDGWIAIGPNRARDQGKRGREGTVGREKEEEREKDRLGEEPRRNHDGRACDGTKKRRGDTKKRAL